eukprot:9928975-Alexandrium_andersonii.AAC.1
MDTHHASPCCPGSPRTSQPSFFFSLGVRNDLNALPAEFDEPVGQVRGAPARGVLDLPQAFADL